MSLEYPYDTAANHLAEMKRRSVERGLKMKREETSRHHAQQESRMSCLLEESSKRSQHPGSSKIGKDGHLSDLSDPIHKLPDQNLDRSCYASPNLSPEQQVLGSHQRGRRYGIADWSPKHLEQMSQSNHAYTTNPSNDPFVEHRPGAQHTEDHDECQRQRKGVLPYNMKQNGNTEILTSTELLHELSNAEREYPEILRDHLNNLEKLKQNSSPATETRNSKKRSSKPSFASINNPQSSRFLLPQICRQRNEEAAEAATGGFPSQNTPGPADNGKKGHAKSIMLRVWSTLRGKNANRAQAFEEILQSPPNYVRPTVSMPNMQSPGLRNALPVRNFSRLYSPSTPDFKTSFMEPFNTCESSPGPSSPQ